MRKELLAALLISAIWIAAGFITAYSAWEMGARISGYFSQTLPDPYTLGLILAPIAILLTFAIVRTLLPSRATQRRRLIRLLDDIGVEEIDAIQRKLASLPEEETSLEALLYEQKRKNRAD